jgi:predicted dehydrogenase
LQTHLGTEGREPISLKLHSFSAANSHHKTAECRTDRPTRLFIDDSGDLFGSGITTETFPVSDQYTLQGDAFSKAVLEDTEVTVSVEDALKNMAVIDAIFKSANSGQWEFL